MVTVRCIQAEDLTFVAIDIHLPKTHLIAISANGGYIMCGALDVHLLNTRLRDRGIIAGRAVGVKSAEELLNAPLESVTDAAAALGIQIGMSGLEALRIMHSHTPKPV